MQVNNAETIERDWDQAYSNVMHVADSAAYPPMYLAQSKAFRSEMMSLGRFNADLRYGPRERNLLDLVMPTSKPKGLVVFVHGGYWLRFDKSYWTYLARGAFEHGYAVAIPSYTLCPEAFIPEITVEIGKATTLAASMIDGPIHLAGHSAGGHLVARMATKSTPLALSEQRRLRKIVPISALNDLRPLLQTQMNSQLQLDSEQARLESPVLLEPLDGIDVTAWVGADELPEFVRQNSALANLWSGFNCAISQVEEAGKHHMNIVNGLADAGHSLTREVLCL